MAIQERINICSEDVEKKMKLRKLEVKDADLMLEWMHDPFVVKDLQTDFVSKIKKDCENFITTAQECAKDLHLAIVNNEDEYMGTVSLKHITKDSAEFAITVRKAAMGKGYSNFAMHEIIRIGLEEMKLSQIYWCVSSENKRAIRFYDKNGYQRIDISGFKFPIEGYTQKQINSYFWYQVSLNARNEK